MATLLRAPEQMARTPVTDSRRWRDFESRDGDILIWTFAKCGTAWAQQASGRRGAGDPKLSSD